MINNYINIPRKTQVVRETEETKIDLCLNLDGIGRLIGTSHIDFFDHMLNALAKHSGFDINLTVLGDFNIEPHHTIEDIGIVLGTALNQALGDKAKIVRFGDVVIPMDEALVQAIVDISGRGYLEFSGEPDYLAYSTIYGDKTNYSTVMNQHFFYSFVTNANLTLHLRVLAGRDPHHITEAEFKALGRVLRLATKIDVKAEGIPSTKGKI